MKQSSLAEILNIDVELQSQVNSYLDDAPLTDSRKENPNLHPVKRKARKKPPPELPEMVIENPEILPSPSPVSVIDSSTYKVRQPFWKFHLLRFANDMYLTTNPSSRHLHCRSSPGYFVTVAQNDGGFTMTFEDFESGQQILKIRKHSEKEGGFFRFKMKRLRRVENGVLVDQEVTDEMFENFVRPHTIPPDFYHGMLDACMTNYEVCDFNNQKWDVGSIPWMKHKWPSGDVKYIGKQNVYLHNNFTGRKTYTGIPLVVSVFRVCESRPKKRMIRSINRLLKIDVSGEKLKPQLVEIDPYFEVKSYYIGGDGLYFDRVPKDDEPDHRFKLGWLTVYEDDNFSQSGMFDFVVAMSVAVGYYKNFQGGMR